MDIRLPSLGESADSGVVANIFVKEGDTIQKDQPIIELESEKAVASIPSPAAGKVTKIRVKQGDKITVGQIILSIGDAEGASPAAKGAAAAPVLSAPSAAAENIESDESADQPVTSGGSAASPTVRKLARDLGIDLNKVRGTESGGRVGVGDLRAYIQRLERIAAQPKTVSGQAARPAAERVDFSQWGPILKKPMTPLRRAIAHKMSESWAAVARVTQFDEADITALGELKKKYDPIYERDGVRLTLTPLIIKAVCACLKKHPLFNSSIDESAEEIILKEYYHIGIAVDTEAGLIVPVIRDADRKSLLELSIELNALAEKTRQRKILPDDLKGGTFTISNQGAIGGGHFTPIVNRPEVAILGLGRGLLKPVIKDGHVVPRMMLPVAVSYDHRVVDGANAARFTRDLCLALETFSELDIKP